MTEMDVTQWFQSQAADFYDTGYKSWSHGMTNVSIFEREQFYPGPGIEPGPLALRDSALPLRHPGQLLIQGRINLFEPIHSDLRTTNSVVATSYRDMHSYIGMTNLKEYFVFTTTVRCNSENLIISGMPSVG